MNRMTVAAISALGFLSLTAMAAEARVVWQFKSNGDFASLDSYQGGNDYLSLSVSKGGTAQAPETYLNYYRSDCDWYAGVCEGVNAYGLIPNRDFSGSTNTASLNTNTSANSAFTATRWTYNSLTGEYSETPTSLGTLNLSWKSSGVSRSKYVGSSSSTYLNFSWRSTGQASQSQASVTGTINGEAVDSNDGSVGTNSNNERYLEKP
jgi:hypothetical protein